MENDVLERSVLMDCPACGHRHFVEERSHMVCWSIKGEHISSYERYYICTIADELSNFHQAEMNLRQVE